MKGSLQKKKSLRGSKLTPRERRHDAAKNWVFPGKRSPNGGLLARKGKSPKRKLRLRILAQFAERK
jgi:hypothetical protein